MSSVFDSVRILGRTDTDNADVVADFMVVREDRDEDDQDNGENNHEGEAEGVDGRRGTATRTTTLMTTHYSLHVST